MTFFGAIHKVRTQLLTDLDPPPPVRKICDVTYLLTYFMDDLFSVYYTMGDIPICFKHAL